MSSRLPSSSLVENSVPPNVPNVNAVLPSTNWAEVSYNLATRFQLNAVARRHRLQVPRGALKSDLVRLLREARIPPPSSSSRVQDGVYNAEPIADEVKGSDAILSTEQLRP